MHKRRVDLIILLYVSQTSYMFCRPRIYKPELSVLIYESCIFEAGDNINETRNSNPKYSYMHLDIFVENLEVQLSNTAITSEYSEIGTRNISQHTPQYTSLTGAEVREVGEDAIPGRQESTYANRFVPAEDHDSSEANIPEYQVANDDKYQSAVQIGSTKSTTASQAVVYKNVVVYENLLDNWQLKWVFKTTEQADIMNEDINSLLWTTDKCTTLNRGGSFPHLRFFQFSPRTRWNISE